MSASLGHVRRQIKTACRADAARAFGAADPGVQAGVRAWTLEIGLGHGLRSALLPRVVAQACSFGRAPLCRDGIDGVTDLAAARRQRLAGGGARSGALAAMRSLPAPQDLIRVLTRGAAAVGQGRLAVGISLGSSPGQVRRTAASGMQWLTCPGTVPDSGPRP